MKTTSTQGYQVVPINAFDDNYIWCIQQGGNAIIVDPGDARPVQAYLQQHQLTLCAVLITHHHRDHIGGLKTLHEHFPDAPIYASSSERITPVTHSVQKDDVIRIPAMSLSFRVMALTGHTRDHIGYYSAPMLFSGDTLFSAGCGRLFEGTPAQMQDTLTQIGQLPDNTLIYASHEYTLANLRFARHVEPDNAKLSAYEKRVIAERQSDRPTLPCQLGLEKQINPFLRCTEPSVIDAVNAHSNKTICNEVDTFALLRQWKDHF